MTWQERHEVNWDGRMVVEGLGIWHKTGDFLKARGSEAERRDRATAERNILDDREDDRESGG